MRAIILFTLFVGLRTAAAQPLPEAYWERILERADSVVIARFGSAFFLDHIFTPDHPLDYIAFGEHSCPWEDRDTVTQVPTYCHFEYDIGFDTLNFGRLNIMFNITPEGHLLGDEDLQGFVAPSGPVKFHTDLAGFIGMARQSGVKCTPGTAFRDLRWVPLDTVARIHPNGDGRYELILGKVRAREASGSSAPCIPIKWWTPSCSTRSPGMCFGKRRVMRP